jgi:heterodisulfide reductase subunit B
MKLAYYPGCSLEATAKEYDLSTRAVCRVLEVELSELQDWNCCGATSAHSTNHLLGIALPARNLALAQQAGMDVTVPCSACYSRLKTAAHLMDRDEAVRKRMEDAIGFKYSGKIKVLSLIEALTTNIGLAKISEKVIRPLTGLKVVCYYGCLLVRPPEIAHFEQPENPSLLDELMKILGAQSMPWSDKVECCGASLGLVQSAIVRKIVSRLLKHAKEAGAQAIVTACPLCQANLEMRREKEDEGLPIFYFTELMGISFGLKDSQKWLKKHLIDPTPLLTLVNLAG